ncbi:MAG: hypothetical protein NC388_09155 [Clostridium sp.]|nr:hypothetical protein [Clostridium sp.]
MAVEASRWGIIYCPKEGITATHRQWEVICRYLNEKHVEYDFVQSERKESVERLAAMLAQNGYSTIVIVGGDAALNRALNGLLSVGEDARRRIALGVIPYGWANDFAEYWGFKEDNYKQTIDWLIARRLRKVDVGCCTIRPDGGGILQRYFLNCVNVGLVAGIMNLKHNTQRFWGMRSLSFFSSAFLLLFQRMETKMHFRVNQDEIDRRIMTVCVSSASGYGQTPSAVPYNGMLDVSVVSHLKIMQMVEGFWMLARGRFLNHKNVKSYRTKKVSFQSFDKTLVSLDGSVWKEAAAPMDVSVCHEWIDFIIPS